MNKFNLILTAIVFMCISGANAQLLKKLSKTASDAAERTMERKVEEKTEQKTGEVIDEVFEAPGKLSSGSEGKKDKDTSSEQPYEETNSEANQNNGITDGSVSGTGQSTIDIVSGSSFFPEGNVIFSEDFSPDSQGDFPSRWETNAGGEVILINETKALRMYPNGIYIAEHAALPDNYALDFEFTTANLDYKGLSGSGFFVELVNEKSFAKTTEAGARFGFSLWAGSSQPDKISVENWGKNVAKIQNSVNYKMADRLNGTIRFTVVVNGKRLRVFIDNEKALDLPSLLQSDAGRYFRFSLRGTDNSMQHIAAISNIKITEEGEDLRSMLLKGGFSTTKILFNSGSDQIKPESYEFLQKVGKALNEEPSLRIMVVGHTDSDGDEVANMNLSKSRAASVANYLIDYTGVEKDRLLTQGMGENEPVADNTTTDGKAQNRRVEFQKL
ncbi:MAG: OmpA family protein [Cyclobacteriaceae bacterium]|nr:OmpA family protein [Cyclobacteriaceae bacterium]